MCYPQPEARFCVCVHLFVRGVGGWMGGIDCAGPQTMCVPQGVVGGQLDREHRGSCCPPPSPLTIRDLSNHQGRWVAEQTLAPSCVYTHVSTWQRGRARRHRVERLPQVSLMGLLCVCRLCSYTILSPNGTWLFYMPSDGPACNREHSGDVIFSSWFKVQVNKALTNPLLLLSHCFPPTFLCLDLTCILISLPVWSKPLLSPLRLLLLMFMNSSLHRKPFPQEWLTTKFQRG